MRKVFRKIHLWLSIPLGLIITVICLSGAMLVFRDEIDELTHHDRYFVKDVIGDPLSIEVLADKVNSQLTDNSVTSVRVPADPDRNYVFGLAKNRSSAYVNPYTGELVDITQRAGDSFFGTMLRLHRWLLDGSRDLGKSIVGYTTLVFVFIIITGFFIWWPKSRKQLKNRLQVKTKYGIKRFWIDTHTTIGMYAFIGLLVLSLTGLTYSFRWYNKGFYKMFGVEVPEQNRKPQNQTNASDGSKNRKDTHKDKGKEISDNHSKSDSVIVVNTAVNDNMVAAVDSGKHHGKQNQGERRGVATKNDTEQQNDSIVQDKNIMNSWTSLLAELRILNPEFKSISIQEGSATVMQDHTFGNSRASDKYTFDNQTGEITNIQLYKDQDKLTKMRGWVYSIHIGSWGGLFSKTLTCIVALIGASLPLTGYYMFYIKRKRKLKKTTI